MTQLSIISCGSLGDGSHAAVRLIGSASGPLSWKAFPAPTLEDAQDVVAFQPQSLIEPDLWHVRLPSEGLWYIWAMDNAGAAEPFPCWVDVQQPGYNPGLDLAQTCDWMQRTLESHVPGINARLQESFEADASIQVVHYGSTAALRSFPSILITEPRVSVEWVAFPVVREYIYSVQVMVILLHQDQESLLPVATHMVEAIMAILNNPIYDRITLPNGTELAFCLAESGESMESPYDEKLWAAIASLKWSGRTITQGYISPPA